MRPYIQSNITKNLLLQRINFFIEIFVTRVSHIHFFSPTSRVHRTDEQALFLLILADISGDLNDGKKKPPAKGREST